MSASDNEEIEELRKVIERLGKQVNDILRKLRDPYGKNPHDFASLLEEANQLLIEIKETVAPASFFARELEPKSDAIVNRFEFNWLRLRETINRARTDLGIGLRVNKPAVLQEMASGFTEIMGVVKSFSRMKKDDIRLVMKRFRHEVELAKHGAHASQVRKEVVKAG